jgi:hypothetical protein
MFLLDYNGSFGSHLFLCTVSCIFSLVLRIQIRIRRIRIILLDLDAHHSSLKWIRVLPITVDNLALLYELLEVPYQYDIRGYENIVPAPTLVTYRSDKTEFVYLI